MTAVVATKAEDEIVSFRFRGNAFYYRLNNLFPVRSCLFACILIHKYS